MVGGAAAAFNQRNDFYQLFVMDISAAILVAWG
jgi:hypothetical protein